MQAVDPFAAATPTRRRERQPQASRDPVGVVVDQATPVRVWRHDGLHRPRAANLDRARANTNRPVAGWRRVAFASSGDFALLENHAVSSTSTRPGPGNAARTLATPLVWVAIRPILELVAHPERLGVRGRAGCRLTILTAIAITVNLKLPARVVLSAAPVATGPVRVLMPGPLGASLQL